MTIINATWADLGYKRIGPSNWLNETDTTMVAKVIEGYNLHQIQTAGNEKWVRDKARINGASLPSIMSKITSFDRGTFSNTEQYDLITRSKDTRYEPIQRRILFQGNLQELANTIDLGSSRPDFIYNLGVAISLCNPDLLSNFLQTHALPKFFSAYPEGRVAVYKANYEFEKRFALLRCIYSLSHYNYTELAQEQEFAALRHWQTLDTIKAPRNLFTLLGASLYPNVHFVSSGPIGLFFVFILDPSERYIPPHFPTDWMSFPKSHWDFGYQGYDHMSAITNRDSAAAITAEHGRFLNTQSFSATAIENLIDWYVNKYSEFSFHLSDPSEFTPNGFMDAVTTYEYGLTIDRVFRKAISCVVSDENTVRKSASQEVADIIETLRTVWDPTVANTEYFKTLHHHINGKRIVLNCFNLLPTPFDTYFAGVVNNIYDDLLNSIRDSVWVKAKLTPTGVMVKDRRLTTEREEDSAEFVSNVIRAFRNAHHGYLSVLDRSNRPSRYLSLVNGDTPDSMAHLGALWTLALLASPREMLNWNWMPIAAWD